MLVLGLKGSPRKGNTYLLLMEFLKKCKELGARCKVLDVTRMKISGCQECGNCEKEGICPYNDDMQSVYPLLREADVIVVATPVFFYSPPAQLKALIDRTQTLWSRKYVHRLKDPGSKTRKGVILSCGATKGKNLFEPTVLIAKYFFDAIDANFSEEDILAYRKIDKLEDIKKHPSALKEAGELAEKIVSPYVKRKKILFLCRENRCRSQMAYGFTRYHLGDKLDVLSAGTSPAKEIHPLTEKVMAEKSLDLGYTKPKSLKEVLAQERVDVIFTLGCEDECINVEKIKKLQFNFVDPSEASIDLMRKVRDEIEDFVKSFDFNSV